MAKAFTSLKSSKLGLYDFFTFGKYVKCRVDTIATDDPGYIEYLDKKKIVVFTDEVIELALRTAGYKNDQRHEKEEIKPWVPEIPRDMRYGNRYAFDDFEYDDIPF